MQTLARNFNSWYYIKEIFSMWKGFDIFIKGLLLSFIIMTEGLFDLIEAKAGVA
jgi:hypothetical protein